MIQTVYTRDSYPGDNSQTIFAFTSRILAKTDLIVMTKVIATGVVATLTLNTDYTIPDADVNTASGGNITTTVAVATGTRIYLIRKTARTQLVNIEEGGAFSTADMMKALDRLTMMVQELDEVDSRALKFARSSQFEDIDVPDPVSGTFLSWLNNLLVNSNIGDTGAEETITATATEFNVVFASPLSDANYQVVVMSPNWNTTVNWSGKLTTGFTLTFGTPAPSGAKCVWRVLR